MDRHSVHDKCGSRFEVRSSTSFKGATPSLGAARGGLKCEVLISEKCSGHCFRLTERRNQRSAHTAPLRGLSV